MRILIKQIGKGIYVQEEDRIASFDIIGQFKNGIHFKIKDNVPYDLRKFCNNEIECLLLANLSKFPEDISSNYKPSHLIIEGTYIGEYVISEKWKVDDLYQLNPNWHDFNYHAIQTENGIIIVRSNKLINYKIIEGDKFKFKVIDFELMAWKPILGEKEIDPLTYEKNFIAKFWDLMESTREKSKQDSELQKKLIYKELLNWSYDEIYLFGFIKTRLEFQLQFNNMFKKIFEEHTKEGFDFATGVITLGKKAFTDAFLNPLKLYQDIEAGAYTEAANKIRSSLDIVQSVIEEKSGISINKVETSYISRDIEQIRDRINRILDDELNIESK